MTRRRGLLALALLMPLLAHPAHATQSCSWVAAWTASPVQTVPAVNGRTYRSLLPVHYPGRTVRVRLTNALGTAPVHVDAVTAGLASVRAALLPGTLRDVRFGGRRAVTLPAGKEIWSDPVPLAVTGADRVGVSFFATGSSGRLTAHTSEPQAAGSSPSEAIPVGLAEDSPLSYLSLPGDHTRDASATSFVQPDAAVALVNGIDVHPDRPVTGVVALGDSITDGFGATPDTDRSWPSQLSRKALTARLPVAVVNAGISGGRVIASEGRGPTAVDRLDRDVLSQSGVRAILLLEGINDIGGRASAAQVIAGYRQIVARAHARHVRVIAALLTPSGDLTRPSALANYSFPAVVATRHAVNAWITSSHAFDAVVDFESAVADDSSEHWRVGYSVDGLHGNDAGYGLLADAVPLRLLDDLPRC